MIVYNASTDEVQIAYPLSLSHEMQQAIALATHHAHGHTDDGTLCFAAAYVHLYLDPQVIAHAHEAATENDSPNDWCYGGSDD